MPRTWHHHDGSIRRHRKKGQKSRTRAGRRDFTTKKSSTKFNSRRHRQRRSARGVKRRPYSRRRVGGIVKFMWGGGP